MLDDQERPLRWLSLDELADADSLKDVTRNENIEKVTLASTLNDALDDMLTSSHGVVVVTGRRDAYQGVIRVETIMDAMAELRDASARRSRRRDHRSSTSNARAPRSTQSRAGPDSRAGCCNH